MKIAWTTAGQNLVPLPYFKGFRGFIALVFWVMKVS